MARGHIAQILIARGYATELKEALRKYLSKGTPGYVQKEVLSPEECIQLVHDAGGLIFVAHLHQIDPQDPEDVYKRQFMICLMLSSFIRVRLVCT